MIPKNSVLPYFFVGIRITQRDYINLKIPVTLLSIEAILIFSKLLLIALYKSTCKTLIKHHIMVMAIENVECSDRMQACLDIPPGLYVSITPDPVIHLNSLSIPSLIVELCCQHYLMALISQRSLLYNTHTGSARYQTVWKH